MERQPGLVGLGAEEQVGDAAREADHLVEAREELTQLREQPTGRLTSEQLVYAVHQAELGGAEGGLVEHALEQLAAAHDHRRVLGLRLASPLGCAPSARRGLRASLHGEMARVRVQVKQQVRDHLLARPAHLRLEQCGHGQRRHTPVPLEAAQVHVREVEQLHDLGAREEGVALRQQHPHHDVVLDEATQRLPVGGYDVLVVGRGDPVCLGARELVLAHVHIHLVAVEVRIVRVAVGVVHADHLLPHEHTRLVRHDAGLVQRRLPVDQEGIARAKMTPDLLARARRLTATTEGHARDRSVHGLLTPERPTTAAVDRRTQPRQVAHRGEEGALGAGTLAALAARRLRRRGRRQRGRCRRSARRSAIKALGRRGHELRLRVVGVIRNEQPLGDGGALRLRELGEVEQVARGLLHHGRAGVHRRPIDDGLTKLDQG